MRVSKEQREALQDAARGATPGPWEAQRVAFRDTASHSIKIGDKVLALVGWESEEPVRAPADSAHIATANPDVILDLLADLDAAERECDENAAIIGQMSDDLDHYGERAERAEAELAALRDRARALAWTFEALGKHAHADGLRDLLDDDMNGAASGEGEK